VSVVVVLVLLAAAAAAAAAAAGEGRGWPLCARLDHTDAVISCCCHFIKDTSDCERMSVR
jgi:hypothetical protein